MKIKEQDNKFIKTSPQTLTRSLEKHNVNTKNGYGMLIDVIKGGTLRWDGIMGLMGYPKWLGQGLL